MQKPLKITSVFLQYLITFALQPLNITCTIIRRCLCTCCSMIFKGHSLESDTIQICMRVLQPLKVMPALLSDHFLTCVLYNF